jgi:hypothetical protein
MVGVTAANFLSGMDKKKKAKEELKKRNQPTAEERELLSEATRIAEDPSTQAATRIDQQRNRELISGREGTRKTTLGTAASDVSQAFRGPTTNQNQAVTNAITRGRGLTRVLGATSQEFDNQLMHDRVSAVQRSQTRRSAGFSALAQAANIRAGVNQSNNALSDTLRGLRQNTLGTAAGIGAGIYANRNELGIGRGGRINPNSVVNDNRMDTSAYV